jgi:HAD superfamily hydrolase (TIGR01509 family)
MALEAVLFDMDGVLVNSEPLHRKAFHQVFEDLTIHVPTEVYYSFSGASTQHIADKLVEQYDLKVSPQYIIDKKRAYFKDLFFNDLSFDLLPGVRELLDHYRTNGIKMVVASSASQVTIQMVFERFGIASYFLGRVSGADLKASKPHPEIFQKAAALTDTPPTKCMVIEDATNGIMAAHRAGIFCAAYKSPHTHLQDYSLANLVVEDYTELYLGKLEPFFS